MIGVISRANEIFEQTDWLEHQNCSIEASGFGFQISSIEIWNNKSDPNRFLDRDVIEAANNTNFDEECTQNDARMICRYLKAFAKKVEIEETNADGGLYIYLFIKVKLSVLIYSPKKSFLDFLFINKLE